MDRHCASPIVRRVARRAGVDKPIGPHTLRQALSSPPHSTLACRRAMFRKRPRTLTREPPGRARVSPNRHATCILAAYLAAAYLAGAAR